MLLASGSSVTAMKLESESVGIALTCHLERNNLRESLETMIGRNGVCSAEKYIEKV